MVLKLNLPCSVFLTMVLLYLPVDLNAQAAFSRAKVNYILQCQGCHQADGSGTQATPNLITHGKIFLSSPMGRDFFISVPGVATAPLSDEELTDLINYVIETIIIKTGDAKSFFYEIAELSEYRQTKIVEDIAVKRNEIIGNSR